MTFMHEVESVYIIFAVNTASNGVGDIIDKVLQRATANRFLCAIKGKSTRDSIPQN